MFHFAGIVFELADDEKRRVFLHIQFDFPGSNRNGAGIAHHVDDFQLFLRGFQTDFRIVAVVEHDDVDFAAAVFHQIGLHPAGGSVFRQIQFPFIHPFRRHADQGGEGGIFRTKFIIGGEHLRNPPLAHFRNLPQQELAQRQSPRVHLAGEL
ncbi:hypothetical protein SDC9_188981 [bioreactor metagenome]|uniref:Uncharacterized protein n=1 Tax=bioreactor metagenome TaxID=1076179 RepID=A0A645HQU4_9ZZZZ